MEGKPFEIGLVGAGAVSAGAYTGGVVDFLVQALDACYAAKQARTPGVPPHDVRLSVFSGASAGGITAALAAGYLASDQPPIRDRAAASGNAGRNKLFDCWVDRVDIEDLLTARDLPGDDAPVVSLLDSTVLAEVADVGLAIEPRPTPRPYLADDFHLLLTVTNLRGVPYAIPLDGDINRSHSMSLHADYVHFALNRSGECSDPDVTGIAWGTLGRAGTGAEQLKRSALASGAFPVGLAPRTLAHILARPGEVDFYSSRKWPVPIAGQGAADRQRRCVKAESIPVDWAELAPGFRYDFVCVDGGVMNNEPLELARRLLAGDEGRNERAGDRAEKAVLMIDPFPSDFVFDPVYDSDPPDLAGQVLALFNALKNQTRFKPDELMLAAHPQNYSRFLIAPKRGDQVHPIASGSLGGFGGFLKRDFREHDFFLGRRNAQKFLKDRFVLLETNPLFVDWTEEMKQRHCARDRSGAPIIRETQRLLPIVPLVDEAVEVCAGLSWPSYSNAELELLGRRLDERFKVVMDRLIDQYFRDNNWLVRTGAKWLTRGKRDDLVDYVKKVVIRDLSRMGLLRD